MSKFRMTAGDTKVLLVSVVDDDDGDPVDISGTTIRFQMSRFATDAEPLVEKSSGSGIEITDGPGGQLEITLEPEDTADFAGSYYFEAEVDDGDVVSTVLRGRATVDAALIQPA